MAYTHVVVVSICECFIMGNNFLYFQIWSFSPMSVTNFHPDIFLWTKFIFVVILVLQNTFCGSEDVFIWDQRATAKIKIGSIWISAIHLIHFPESVEDKNLPRILVMLHYISMMNSVVGCYVQKRVCLVVLPLIHSNTSFVSSFRPVRPVFVWNTAWTGGKQVFLLPMVYRRGSINSLLPRIDFSYLGCHKTYFWVGRG